MMNLQDEFNSIWRKIHQSGYVFISLYHVDGHKVFEDRSVRLHFNLLQQLMWDHQNPIMTVDYRTKKGEHVTAGPFHLMPEFLQRYAHFEQSGRSDPRLHDDRLAMPKISFDDDFKLLTTVSTKKKRRTSDEVLIDEVFQEWS